MTFEKVSKTAEILALAKVQQCFINVIVALGAEREQLRWI
jgi:hypothetical protein